MQDVATIYDIVATVTILIESDKRIPLISSLPTSQSIQMVESYYPYQILIVVWKLWSWKKPRKIYPRCEPWCWNIYLHLLQTWPSFVGKYSMVRIWVWINVLFFMRRIFSVTATLWSSDGWFPRPQNSFFCGNFPKFPIWLWINTY